ncbi:ORF6N domain-containing protein, partial [uncultured Parabacteroides sp.]|uniref:ORF6N domain-containing protein n=1 Tax=uncultured Parabacteroides sp. TaxID=512312 RepID=UPI00265A48CA
MEELEIIQNKIYEIRGYKVMLDFDLAEMYQVETKRLKEAVRRNMERFEGDDFMFELNKEELIVIYVPNQINGKILKQIK